MSKARSPRAVCSITIGISGFIDASDAVLSAFNLTPAGRGAHLSLYPDAARVRRGSRDCLDENVRRFCGHREFNSIRRADPESAPGTRNKHKRFGTKRGTFEPSSWG